MLPRPYAWDRAVARAGGFNGKFLIGVRTTGIYCLPSCGARAPKPDNVRVLATEAEAHAAGLRPCKRCRPDLFYRGIDADAELFGSLAHAVRRAPADFPDARALARRGGVSLSKLGALLRVHAHLTPAVWLRREQIRSACGALLETSARSLDIAHRCGFTSESAFHRQFLGVTRMTPGAYRALPGSTTFMLRLPRGYRAREILDYHARDPASPCERADGARIYKALTIGTKAAVLEIEIEAPIARCRLHGHAPTAETASALHSSALRMLGLLGDISGFELRVGHATRIAPLVRRRPGLRLPLTPTPFEALCWAVIGQQINVRFASALRREVLELAGEPTGAMRAHPSAARLAELESPILTKRRFSRSKAEYLIGAARAVAGGALDVDALGDASAVAAERDLRRLHGIGPWTARYTLLRGVGFADCAPVGDVALAAALQRLMRSEQRPGNAEVESLMQAYSPHRSIATVHLWTSLRDAA